MRRYTVFAPIAALFMLASAAAQQAPSAAEQAAYRGVFAAAASGDTVRLRELLEAGAPVDERDGHRRTPLHVAAFGGRHAAMRELVGRGADPNALDGDRYDIVTIAAVADDRPTLDVALALGCRPGNVTSRYDGTALIAAAHLGHAEVVRTLVGAGAPLDHVNNLGWTALIEAIVLGDGGARHVATMQALLDGGADVRIADRAGRTPLVLATERGYATMQALLRKAGAR